MKEIHETNSYETKKDIIKQTELKLSDLKELTSLLPKDREIIKINSFINFYRTENLWSAPDPKEETSKLSEIRSAEITESINNGPSVMIDMQGTTHIDQVVKKIKKDNISYNVTTHSWGKELTSKTKQNKKLFLVDSSKWEEFINSQENTNFGIVSFRGHNHQMNEKTAKEITEKMESIQILHFGGCQISKNVIEKSESSILWRGSFLDHFKDKKDTKFVISNQNTGKSAAQTPLLLGLHAFMPNQAGTQTETNAYIKTNGNILEYFNKAYEKNKSFADNGITLTVIDQD